MTDPSLVEPTERSEEVVDDVDEEPVDAHLQDLEDGAGCTEIWQHLSERRDDE